MGDVVEIWLESLISIFTMGQPHTATQVDLVGVSILCGLSNYDVSNTFQNIKDGKYLKALLAFGRRILLSVTKLLLFCKRSALHNGQKNHNVSFHVASINPSLNNLFFKVSYQGGPKFGCVGFLEKGVKNKMRDAQFISYFVFDMIRGVFFFCYAPFPFKTQFAFF